MEGERPSPSLTKSLRIEHFILSGIRSGEFKPGDKIPTEKELQEMFGASRITVRNALSSLKNRGILVSYPKKGTFVSARAFSALGERKVSPSLIKGLSVKLINVVRTLKVPLFVLEELGLGKGKRVTQVIYLKIKDSEPVALCKSYFDASRFSGFSPSIVGWGSFSEAFLSFYGLKLGFLKVRFDQVRVQRKDAAVLGVKTGELLLRVRRTLFDELGNPVLYSSYIVRGDMVEIGIVLEGQ